MRSPAACPSPSVLAVCDDPAVIGAPFYVMERLDGVVMHRRGPPGADAGRRAARRPRRLIDALVDAPRRRLARGRAGGLRPAGRLPRAPARPLRRAVGAQPHARLPAVERVGALARGTVPDVAAGDDRARRLPARQRDVRARAAAAAWSRSSTGRCRRSATRSPTSATCARSGSQRDDPPAGVFEQHAFTRAPGWPTREELRRALRGALGPRDGATPLVPGARALEDHRLHGGQLPARAGGLGRRSVPDAFGEAIAGLAERARRSRDEPPGFETGAARARGGGWRRARRRSSPPVLMHGAAQECGEHAIYLKCLVRADA